MNKAELMKTADLLRSLAVEAQDHAEYLRSFDNPLQDRSAAQAIITARDALRQADLLESLAAKL